MGEEKTTIELFERTLLRGEESIARLRSVIISFRKQGRSTDDAERMLAVCEELQQIWKDALARQKNVQRPAPAEQLAHHKPQPFIEPLPNHDEADGAGCIYGRFARKNFLGAIR